MNPLDMIGQVASGASLGTADGRTRDAAPADGNGGLFAQVLDQVNDMQARAADMERRMYEGGDVELHRVMIAAEQAGTSFELLVEMRNRLVEAYQELMRMPV